MNIFTTSKHTVRVLATAAGLTVAAGFPATAGSSQKLDMLCAQPYQTSLMRALVSVPRGKASGFGAQWRKGVQLYWKALQKQPIDTVNSAIMGDWDFHLTSDDDGNVSVMNPEGKEFDKLDLVKVKGRVGNLTGFPSVPRRALDFRMSSTKVPGRSYTLMTAVKPYDPNILFIRQAVNEDPVGYTTLMLACTKAGDAD